MSMVEVKVPDIGDFKEVEVIELMVKVGDTIKVDQSLVTVESEVRVGLARSRVQALAAVLVQVWPMV